MSRMLRRQIALPRRETNGKKGQRVLASLNRRLVALTAVADD